MAKKVYRGDMENEILNSHNIEDLFFYNYRNEFDWVKTLNFIKRKRMRLKF